MKKYLSLTILLFAFYGAIISQEHPSFTITKYIKNSPVKSQGSTGTCWAFSTISFLESEAIRMNKPVLDLSEMYIVKHVYPEKAQKYIRLHGMGNFSEGGQAHDVLNAVKKYGLVTEETYKGLNYNSKRHKHGEMVAMLENITDAVVETRKSKNSSNWKPVFNAVLEQYLGAEPQKTTFKGKDYSPTNFAKNVVGINVDDYVEFTSFSCYPYNAKVDLEVPDNWSHDLYYNVKYEDLMQIIDYALSNGYSVCWDGDTSEDDFNHRAGTAVISMKESDEITSKGVEKMRQETFDNFSTTDDHLMHLVGLAHDKDNTTFYLTKNSWGSKSNKYGGYLYMSKQYVQLKTVAILVHKDAVPKRIRKKLGF